MCIPDATEEEKPVTRLDSARESSGWSKEAAALYAAGGAAVGALWPESWITVYSGP